MLINFNMAEEKINKFLGSEKKTTILYNDELYMLKYPDPVRADRFRENLSYKNNPTHTKANTGCRSRQVTRLIFSMDLSDTRLNDRYCCLN